MSSENTLKAALKRACRRQAKTIVTVAFVVCSVGAMHYWRLRRPREYSASSILYLDVPGQASDSSLYQEAADVIKSGWFLARVVALAERESQHEREQLRQTAMSTLKYDIEDIVKLHSQVRPHGIPDLGTVDVWVRDRSADRAIHLANVAAQLFLAQHRTPSEQDKLFRAIRGVSIQRAEHAEPLRSDFPPRLLGCGLAGVLAGVIVAVALETVFAPTIREDQTGASVFPACTRGLSVPPTWSFDGERATLRLRNGKGKWQRVVFHRVVAIMWHRRECVDQSLEETSLPPGGESSRGLRKEFQLAFEVRRSELERELTRRAGVHPGEWEEWDRTEKRHYFLGFKEWGTLEVVAESVEVTSESEETSGESRTPSV